MKSESRIAICRKKHKEAQNRIFTEGDEGNEGDTELVPRRHTKRRPPTKDTKGTKKTPINSKGARLVFRILDFGFWINSEGAKTRRWLVKSEGRIAICRKKHKEAQNRIFTEGSASPF